MEYNALCRVKSSRIASKELKGDLHHIITAVSIDRQTRRRNTACLAKPTTTATVPPVPPVLAIASLTLPGAGGGNADGTFSGSLTGATPGFIAELQASSDLSSWTTIATQTVDTNGNATFTNSVDTGSGTDPVARKRRFYRVCAKER